MTVPPDACHRRWWPRIGLLLVIASVLTCCGGVNVWLLTPRIQPDNTSNASALVFADFVKGRQYPVYADAPDVDELRCVIGFNDFERALTVRRSGAAPLFAGEATDDRGRQLPFFGWLRSDRNERIGVRCTPEVQLLLSNGPGAMPTIATTTVVALLLAGAAVVVAVRGRRRPVGAPPSLWLLSPAPLLVLAGLAVLGTAVALVFPEAGEYHRAPQTVQPAHLDDDVVITRGTHYLVYQAGAGAAQDCAGLVRLNPDPPPAVADRVDHVGTEFRYIGDFVGAVDELRSVECATDNPLIIIVDRRPTILLAASVTVFLLSMMAAVGLVAIVVSLRRRTRPSSPEAPVNAAPVEP